MDEHLTPPEVAKLLRVHPSKIIGWIRRGELNARDLVDQPGRRPRYRIERKALEDFLRRREVKPRPRKQPARKPQTSTKKYF